MAGIISAVKLNIFGPLAFTVILILLVSALLLLKLYKANFSPRHWTILLSLTFFVSGICAINLHRQQLRNNYFYKFINENSILKIKLLEPLQEKQKTYKTTAEILQVINEKAVNTSGKILLYIPKNSATARLNYGDILLINNQLKPIEHPRSPQVFDYAEYMGNKQVFYQAFLKNDHWRNTHINAGNVIWKFVYSIKYQLLTKIDEQLVRKDERGIVKALVLGEEAEVLPQVMASYAGTGTLHVLSVSGLHVGIVYLVLSFLLKFLTRSRFGSVFYVLILLSSLWLYALLTGLSPSVSRASAMFSFVAIGVNFRKITNIFNSLAFSALVLLLTDPFLIFQVGFQLSYAAVIGIVWLQPKITRLWQPNKRWKKWLWSAVSVSLAAQIATFPLGLMYFNQFPLYFLPANLVVIPLATLILIAGCCFAALSPINLLQPVLWLTGKILFGLVWLTNAVVDFIFKIPFATVDSIYISPAECLILYLFLLGSVIAFTYRSKWWLKFSFCVLALFFTGKTYAKISSWSKPQLVVHAIQNANVLSYSYANKLYVLGDTAFIFNADKLKFHINRYAFSRYVTAPEIIAVDSKQEFRNGNFYFNEAIGQVKNTRFIWLANRKHFSALPYMQTPVDLLILSGNLNIDLAEIRKKINFKQVIIMPLTSRKRAEEWEKQCKQLNIAFTNLQKHNSFVLNP